MPEPHVMGTLATLYGVGAACTALLQARQVVRRGSSCDVSARFFATYAGGYAVWLLYGISIGSLPLILVDAAGLLCGLVTLAVTLNLRGSLLRPATWAGCAGQAGRPAPASRTPRATHAVAPAPSRAATLRTRHRAEGAKLLMHFQDQQSGWDARP